MSGTHIEAFYGADAPIAASGDLIFKEILREDEFKYTPTSDGIKPVPFRVVRDGTSSKSDRTISMADLVRSFEGKAYPHVQLPLADGPGADHLDYAKINTGFVEKLEVREGSDGKARLVAGMRFTEPDAKGKVERGTIANCSSGIYFNRVRPTDGAEFPAALKHVVLTNTPFIDLKPFGAELSEGDEPDEVIRVALADPDVVWTPNESFSRLQANVEKAFQQLNQAQNPLGMDDPNAKVLFPRDIWTSKALAEDMSTSEVFTVPFKRKKDGVELAPQAEWTRAEQEWVAASESSPVRVHGRAVVEEAIQAVREQRQQQEAEVQASEQDKPDEPAPRPIPRTPEGRLRAAQEERRERISLSDDNNHPGGAPSMAGIDLSELELSDEQRTAIQAALDENRELRTAQHRAGVEQEVQRVQGLGLAENTGFVKLYRRLLLADDGGEAIVLSDESTGEKRTQTLTGALKMLIDALPKNREGKLALSEQALVDEAGRKPNNESDDEVEESHEDALADTKRRLGL